ncbi:hypothetical protein BCR35DRAFT_353767 [Leucosporidium creatinivorum]|uniref:Hydrophobic surface binding protein A-domain-containing protein n=1 Tax=Leucosporidium creatinivorum TaxID=106004 RepID=A0A1Y2ET41_9BASI|nr:hypothetical protein BCR35DRAFT_353767 [Leucosporidium creatinivorum]
MHFPTALVLVASSLAVVTSASPLRSSQLSKRVLNMGALSPAFQALTSEINSQGTLVSQGLRSLPSMSGEAIAATCGPYLTNIDDAVNEAKTAMSLSSARSAKRQLNVDSDAVAQDIADSILALADALSPLAEQVNSDSTLITSLDGFLSPINTDIAVAVGGVAAVVPGVLQQLNSLLSTETDAFATLSTLQLASNLQSMGIGA